MGVRVGQIIVLVIADGHVVYDWWLAHRPDVGVDEAESSVDEEIATRRTEKRFIDEDCYGLVATEDEFNRKLCSSGY